MTNSEHTLWVEKYRPQTLDGYIGNDHIKAKAELYIKNQDIPHILLAGPAGTGKSSLAKILANNIECDYIYINASDENSVEVMRNKIKNFASTIGFNKLKIVILDEADFLTPAAQAILRNLSETFSRSTRFILTCNYIEKVISPIQSRCQTFTVYPPSKKEIFVHIKSILDNENVTYDDKDLATIVTSNYPDIRKIIGTCQMQTIDGELVLDKQNIIELNYISKIIESLKSSDNKLDTFRNIRKIIADSKVKTFESLFKELYDEVEDYGKKNIPSIIITIAEHQYYDALVVDREINAMAMLTKIINEIK